MAVSSAGGHYTGPSGVIPSDLYSNPPSVTSGFHRNRQGPCHFYMSRGWCRKPFCPFDHDRAEQLRRNINYQRQTCPSTAQTVPPQQMNNYQGAMQQAQQAPHHSCVNCCHSHQARGPMEQRHSFGPQRSYPVSHMSQRSDCESVYSQDSFHQPTRFTLPPRNHNNAVDFQEHHHQQHQEAQYPLQNHHFHRGGSLGPPYNNQGQYHESSNFRQGTHERQGPLQRQPSFVESQQLSGVPQQRYGNYVRSQSVNTGFQGVPTGPRADRQNKRFTSSDRSSQNSMDDPRYLTHWQKPMSRPGTDASMSPRISHESQDLIDLDRGPELDSPSPRPYRTIIDLLDEDPPEDAKSLPIIAAAVSQENRPTLSNGLHELIAPFADISLQHTDHPSMTTSSPHDSTMTEREPNGICKSTQRKGNTEKLSNVSENMETSSSSDQDRESALNDHSLEHTSLSKGKNNTAEVVASKSSMSTPGDRPPATAKPSYPMINPDLEDALGPDCDRAMQEIWEKLPHLRSKALRQVLARAGMSQETVDLVISSTIGLKPDGPPQSEPVIAVLDTPTMHVSSANTPGETKLSVAATGQATDNTKPVDNNASVAATSTTHTALDLKKSETLSDSDDELYPSWESRPSSDREKANAKEPQPSRAHSPKQRALAIEEEFHGDGLLGPRPKARWNQFSGNSRPPSPDAQLTSDEPQPLVRITRQHIFDIAYCWNCWSQKHKASDCPEPHRSLEEREQLRIQKRVVSKSWARELESMGRQAALIPIPGVSDEAASRLQTAIPLRNPRKKVLRNFSPAVSVYEENPGSPTERQDWWNNTPPIPDISDAEVAVWANVTVSSTNRQEGTYFEHPWSDISMVSGAETTISSESTEAHMDGACYHSIFNSRSNSESEDESTASVGANSVMRIEQAEEDGSETVGTVSSDTSGENNEGVDIEGERGRGGNGKKVSSDGKPKIRIREPRPEELQEPRVIFVDSEFLTPPRRRRRNTSSERFEQALNGLLSSGRYRNPRKYTSRVDRLSSLPTEILTEIIEYVGLQRLCGDPQTEATVYERSKAEATRAIDLRPLRFVSRKLYLIVQTIIYKRINITSVPDFERLARQLHMRERLANMVLDVTVDIQQLRKNDNWRDYGNPRAIAKSREAGTKMTLGTAHLIRDISSIFENCNFLFRFAFHCTGAIQAFCRLEGEYPSVRKVSICDQLEIGKSGDTFWRNVQRFPNIEEVSLLRAEENRDRDFRQMQINPVGKAWALSSFDNLEYLKFTNAAEISDKLLLHILPNLPKLRRIYLYECKLVTSSGIARVVTAIQDRLTEFVYCDYVDCNGKTSQDEEKTKKSCHLCHALARCPNLRDLSLSAYRICSDLFTMSNWSYLRNLKIDMMFYTGCNNEEEDTDLRQALVEACVEGRLPSLTTSNIVFQTNTPGLIYRRNRKFTQEELERAGGYT